MEVLVLGDHDARYRLPFLLRIVPALQIRLEVVFPVVLELHPLRFRLARDDQHILAVSFQPI